MTEKIYKEAILVFDIETIPAIEDLKNLTGSDTTDKDLARKEMEDYHLEITSGNNAFLRQPFHKIISISYLLASFETNSEKNSDSYVKYIKLGSKSVPECTEKEIIIHFYETLQKLTAQSERKLKLVSFNGRMFDIPVLQYRAMKYGIQSKIINIIDNRYNKNDGYMYRYSELHSDLIEILSQYGASARIKLNEACAVMGFPGKIGVDGSKVAEMYDNKMHQEIADYCETDVLNTYLVYLRYAHHQGRLTDAGYNKSINIILDILENHSNKKHLKEFHEEWIKACSNKFYVEDM